MLVLGRRCADCNWDVDCQDDQYCHLNVCEMKKNNEEGCSRKKECLSVSKIERAKFIVVSQP